MLLKKNQSLFRLVLAYCGMLVLPIIVGTVFIVTTYAQNVKTQYLQNSADRLAEIGSNVDEVLKNLNSVVTTIRLDDNLAAYKLRKNTYYWWVAQQNLNRYMSANADLLDLVYYDAQSDIILSSVRSYTRDLFHSTYYEKAGISSESLWKEIESNSKDSVSMPLYISEYEGRVILTYVFTLPSADPSDSPKLILLLDTKSLLSQMEVSVPTPNSLLFIRDAKQQLLLSTSEVMPETLDVMAELTGETSQSREMPELNGFGACTPSAVSGWYYFLWTPIQDVTQQITVFLYLLLGIEALILVASSLFFAYNLKHYYKPLRTLGNLVRRQSHRADSSKSEYEVIHSALEEMSSLRQDVVNNEEAALKLLLVQLIVGYTEGAGKGADNRRKKEYPFFPTGWDVDSDENYFCLLLLQPAEPTETALLSAVVQKHISSLYVEDISSEGLLVLCPFDGHRTSLLQRLSLAQSLLSTAHGVQTYAYISRTYRVIQDTSEIYKEVSSTAASGQASEENPVIYCDRVMENSYATNSYPVELLDCFRKSLEGKDAGAILENMEQIIVIVCREDCSVAYARFLCYDVIYNVLYTLCSQKENSSLSSGFLSQIEAVMGLNSKEQLLEQMEGIRQLLESTLTEPGYEKLAIYYMEEHYADPDFSIQNLSDELNVSASHLSRQFKNAVGCTLIEYANQLRIEKAKRLLEETNNPLSEIVQQIGYIDVSSFHKKFKAFVGVTPGAYRAQHRTSEE